MNFILCVDVLNVQVRHHLSGGLPSILQFLIQILNQETNSEVSIQAFKCIQVRITYLRNLPGGQGTARAVMLVYKLVLIHPYLSRQNANYI